MIIELFAGSQGSDIGYHVYHNRDAVTLEGLRHKSRKEWAEGI